MRRPQNFAKSLPIICPMYCQSNNWWRFRKILWPSQNIWTLSLELPSYALIQNLSNCWRYKSVWSQPVSFHEFFNWIFWRVFAVWTHCGSTTYCGFGVRRVLGGALCSGYDILPVRFLQLKAKCCSVTTMDMYKYVGCINALSYTMHVVYSTY